MTVSSPLVVLKLGGSLFTLPDLAPRLQRILAQPPDIRPLLIAGGGRMVEEIREWDRRFALGEETCHVLAMESLNVTAGLVAQLVPGSQLVETRGEAEACWSRRKIPVLRNIGPWGEDLPRTWDVTSDSLAADVARTWSAEELWLLKSTDLPPGLTLADASRQGFVDRHFPVVHTEQIALKWCNLRAATPEAVLWL